MRRQQKKSGAAVSLGARQGLRLIVSVRRRNDLDLRHHAPVLVFEDMAMVDEFAELSERDVEHHRRRGAVPIVPLVDGANPVLWAVDGGVDGRFGIATPSGRLSSIMPGPDGLEDACITTEPGLVEMEVMVFGRELHQFPGLVHRRLAGPSGRQTMFFAGSNW